MAAPLASVEGEGSDRDSVERRASEDGAVHARGLLLSDKVAESSHDQTSEAVSERVGGTEDWPEGGVGVSAGFAVGGR